MLENHGVNALFFYIDLTAGSAFRFTCHFLSPL
jgi:hypothetical protein